MKSVAITCAKNVPRTINVRFKGVIKMRNIAVKEKKNRLRIVALATMIIMIILSLSIVTSATQQYLDAYSKTFNTQTACRLCHLNPAGGGTLNPYGIKFQNQPNHATNPEAALASISGAPAVEAPTKKVETTPRPPDFVTETPRLPDFPVVTVTPSPVVVVVVKTPKPIVTAIPTVTTVNYTKPTNITHIGPIITPKPVVTAYPSVTYSPYASTQEIIYDFGTGVGTFFKSFGKGLWNGLMR